MPRLRPLLLISLVAPALSAAAPVAADTLDDTARYIIEDRCGSCHRPDQDTALEAAMAGFDLSKADWAAGLTAEQRETFRLRIEEDSSVPRSDVEVIKRFLASTASKVSPRATGRPVSGQ